MHSESLQTSGEHLFTLCSQGMIFHWGVQRNMNDAPWNM